VPGGGFSRHDAADSELNDVPFLPAVFWSCIGIIASYIQRVHRDALLDLCVGFREDLPSD
jgi:hypothetical protein